MTSLREEADTNATAVEELKEKVKTLEASNLSNEQEIKSLTHRNGVLEAEIEKLESGIKDAKAAADESGQHSTQNEALQRKLQVLEQEAEESEKTLRDTHDKFVHFYCCNVIPDPCSTDCVKQM